MDVGYVISIYVVEWGAGWSILKLFPGVDTWWDAKKCQANMMPTASDDGITAQILFFWAATLNKVSLLCFYKRLTGPVTPLWYKWCIVVALAFHAAMLFAFFVVAVNACK